CSSTSIVNINTSGSGCMTTPVDEFGSSPSRIPTPSNRLEASSSRSTSGKLSNNNVGYDSGCTSTTFFSGDGDEHHYSSISKRSSGFRNTNMAASESWSTIASTLDHSSSRKQLLPLPGGAGGANGNGSTALPTCGSSDNILGCLRSITADSADFTSRGDRTALSIDDT
ncbi:unnamed protein product, partial [Amoebophrya sp. A25]